MHIEGQTALPTDGAEQQAIAAPKSQEEKKKD
jgi:hypothetical protein